MVAFTYNEEGFACFPIRHYLQLWYCTISTSHVFSVKVIIMTNAIHVFKSTCSPRLKPGFLLLRPSVAMLYHFAIYSRYNMVAHSSTAKAVVFCLRPHKIDANKKINMRHILLIVILIVFIPATHAEKFAVDVWTKSFYAMSEDDALLAKTNPYPKNRLPNSF